MEKSAVLQLLQKDIKLSRQDRRNILQKFARFGTPLRRALDKAATLGGDPDQGFEQSFASLAYAHIQDKAPGLLDYMVGFQLVDRNNDNTKAVGVFGFQLSQAWLYAPVFFLSGDLKGHELLYLKQQRAFVPLKENWVNYIVNRRPQVLGEGTSDNMQQLGLRSPNLSSIVLPPGATGKYAADRWARRAGVLEDLRELSESAPAAVAVEKLARENGSALPFDLRQFALTYPQVLPALHAVCDAWPGVKQALAQHYSPRFLSETLTTVRDALRDALAKEARHNVLERPAPAAPKPAPPSPLRTQLKLAAADEPAVMRVSLVQVITHNVPEHTEEERKKLLTDGMLIKDERGAEEVSVAYDTQIPVQLTNPTETGVYEVLVRPGEFLRCLVIMAPFCGVGRKNFCTVAPLDEDRGSAINIHESHIFIKQDTTPADTTTKWFEDLPDTGRPQVDETYVAISPNGSGTCPFTCQDAEPQDPDVHRVRWQSHGKDYADDNNYGSRGYGSAGCCPSDCDAVVIFNTRRGESFLATKHERLYIPERAKLVRIAKASTCDKCDKRPSDCTCDYFHYKEPTPPIRPGDLSDLQLHLSTKLASLKIVTDGSEVCIGSQRFSKRAALLSLVREHHFREGVARELIKQAERRNGARFWVKYAAPMGESFGPPTSAGQGFSSTLPLDQQPPMGSMPYVSAPVEYGMEAAQGIPELSGTLTDPNIYNPMLNMEPEQLRSAQGAKKKQVFDVGMITALTKAVRPLSLTDRDTSALMAALNKLGQMLFMFYWHNEEYSDRYGKKDLPELEDAIRNSFEALGDLILFLKSKSAEPESDAFLNAGASIDASANN